MTCRALPRLLLTAALGSATLSAAVLEPLQPPRLWQRAEWRVAGAPTAENNFDPDQIRLDATFTAPSGAAITIPGFWFQDATRNLVDGVESIALTGTPEWRIRFTPSEAGDYSLTLRITMAGAAAPLAPTTTRFTVPADTVAGPHGWVRTAADHRYLETSDGQPLRLIGANVCWGQARGTHDFDDWFGAMRDAGENFARLWFAPWSMGIEHQPGTLNRYDLKAAWQLDYLLDLADRDGLYVLVAFEHHGMFMVDDPAWGGSNNFWATNSPYSRELGGPCATANEFFTNPEARKLYQKRLRYLVARYGWSPRMLSWQFFNEIDNSYLPRAALVGDDVVAWHREMGQWLRQNDPYHHLISTSLTGGSDRPEYWSMPEIDFTVYHSYAEANPASHLATLADDFVRRYQKPVMIGEFGVSARAWHIEQDPHLRGFRQGLWGGVLGGSVGTSMSWWWEDLHDDNVYPIYTVIRDVMRNAGWNQAGTWSPVAFQTAGPVPVELGAPITGADPFSANLALNALRRNPVSGVAAIANRLAATRSAERISSYLHAPKDAALQQSITLGASFADGARLTARVNSVAANADLIIRVDGSEVLRAPLVDTDGKAIANGEINKDFSVAIPAGQHRIEIAHAGADWVNLDSVRLERVRPAAFADDGQFAPEPIGLRSGQTAVVYVPSPHVAWPAGALRVNPPTLQGETVMIKDWPAGEFTVTWQDPRTGRELAKRPATREGSGLRLTLPDFNEDVVGTVTPAR